MRGKNGNAQAVLEAVCFAAFGLMLLYLAASGKYLTYVAPRIQPYLYFAGIVMLIWAAVTLPRVRVPKYRLKSLHCLVLAVPILVVLLPHQSMTAASVSAGYAGSSALVSGEQTAPIAAPTVNPAAEASTPTETANTLAPTAEPDTQPPEGLDEANKRIVVSNENFYPWLVELFDHIDRYVGYQIQMTGYVLKEDESLKDDEFVPARLAMTCCVSDLQPIGLVCKYKGVKNLKENEWVTVTGVIYKGTYMDQPEPSINATAIEKAQPVEDYIYPN